MNQQLKIKPDDTRARIMDTAEALFRRLGYAKTAVADIAAELKMSPANVYRFFPSKDAIVEAIYQRCLAELEFRQRRKRHARFLAKLLQRPSLRHAQLAHGDAGLLRQTRAHARLGVV